MRPIIPLNYESDSDSEAVKIGDYVKIVKGNFKEYYATITEHSYGDELENNYFAKTSEKSKLYVLKPRDTDSVERDQIVKVTNFSIENRGHLTFN